MGMQVYKVRGEWVDEPFVTFGQAEMVLYADALERERVLREDNERLLEQVRNIADDLGCQEEESHRHHHGRCIFFAIHKLQDDLDRAIKERDAARAALAQ